MMVKRTVLITGCSDGSIGSALALALHQTGWRVIASARDLSKLQAMREAGLECLQMDVCSDASVSTAVEQLQTLLDSSSLDAVINNAGRGYSMPLAHVDIGRLRDLYELNVISVLRVTQAFLPLLLRSKRNPLLVNNTSASSLLGCGTPFQVAYASSKAAATSMTEGLRMELAPFGIRVINLMTGGVRSTFFQNASEAHLPVGSIYGPAKDAIEATMNGTVPGQSHTEAQVWAKQVARDLNQPSPPLLVFRGASAGLARVATMLPTGMMDSTVKKMAGIDVLEQKLLEGKKGE